MPGDKTESVVACCMHASVDIQAEWDLVRTAIYEPKGRYSISPEQYLEASLLQIIYGSRSECQLAECTDNRMDLPLVSGVGA